MTTAMTLTGMEMIVSKRVRMMLRRRTPAFATLVPDPFTSTHRIDNVCLDVQIRFLLLITTKYV